MIFTPFLARNLPQYVTLAKQAIRPENWGRLTGGLVPGRLRFCGSNRNDGTAKWSRFSVRIPKKVRDNLIFDHIPTSGGSEGEPTSDHRLSMAERCHACRLVLLPSCNESQDVSARCGLIYPRTRVLRIEMPGQASLVRQHSPFATDNMNNKADSNI